MIGDVRRRTVVLACLALGVLLLSAGCVDSITDDRYETTYVTVEAVETVPENATVVESTNDSVREIGTVHTALREAANGSDQPVQLSDSDEERFREAIRTLSTNVDRYGLYVRYDGTVYFVSINEYL